MNPLAPVLPGLFAEIASLTAGLGRRVDAQALRISDRDGDMRLGRPGRQSPNGSCRLIETAEGWIALNLARDEDRELLPAWLGQESGQLDWPELERTLRGRTRDRLIADATLLGLPVAAVGEVACGRLEAPLVRPGSGAAGEVLRRPVKVVDLSALWAGPLCGAILAAMGASVLRIESRGRPDPSRISTPLFYGRLNGEKTELQLGFTDPSDRARLADEILATDVLITSARPRALSALGLEPRRLFAANPHLVWVAITGYGRDGSEAQRVAFGDDAAAAGGLVRWAPDGSPQFLGDALADPVTGLAAAIGALKGLIAGGGVIVDAALARCAAGAATALRLESAL